MIELIIIFIIISVVVKQNRKKNDSKMTGKVGSPVTTVSSNPQPMQKAAPVRTPAAPQRMGQNAMPSTANGRQGQYAAPVQGGGQRNYQRNFDSSGNPKPSGQAEKEIQRREGESTTEYLNRKAEMDNREHQKEQFERKRAERQNYGNIVYAGRWMEGDPVPQSRRMVVCSYCGAENLVPIHDRTAYHCYFCREKL